MYLSKVGCYQRGRFCVSRLSGRRIRCLPWSHTRSSIVASAFCNRDLPLYRITVPNINAIDRSHGRYFSIEATTLKMRELHDLISQDFVARAQHLLDEMTESGSFDEEVLNAARAKVLDAWIQHQEKLLETYKSSCEHNDRSQLMEICQAAKEAHNLLEKMEPLLASTSLSVYSSYADGSNKAEVAKENMQDQRRKEINVELTRRCDAVLTAWARASRAGHGMSTRITRAIPQRAQFLLERMEASHNFIETTERTVRPSVESHNRVLEAWAYSNEHLRGAMAERIFQKLQQSGGRSNGESYQLVIWAWALSRDRRAAFTATGHLMKMLRLFKKGVEDMEPSLKDYHVILKAWTQAEDKMSPAKAESVLKLMGYAYEEGMTEVQPDEACYRYVLLTAARRPELQDLGLMVDSILTQMKERFMVPDSTCYGAAIRTWKHCALNNDLLRFRENSVRRTLDLLAEMKVANNRTVSTSVKASTQNINDAIEALSVSEDPYKTKQAETLLQEMEQAITNESNGPKPNADSYRFVLEVWASSDSIEKVPRAKSILWHMKNNYDVLFVKSNKKDGIVEAFNSFVRVCSSANVRDEEEGLQVFKEALAAIEMMRILDGLYPNAASYALLLQVCKNLLPPGKEMRRLVEKVFRVCCSDGMVDDNVLKQLQTATTAEQYTSLVIAASEDVEGTRMVPEAWTINALGGRVVTADGRRTTPLSIEGKLTVTMAMQEFKMRRIRDKRNRNLLRGGRWRKTTAASHPP